MPAPRPDRRSGKDRACPCGAPHPRCWPPKPRRSDEASQAMLLICPAGRCPGPRLFQNNGFIWLPRSSTFRVYWATHRKELAKKKAPPKRGGGSSLCRCRAPAAGEVSLTPRGLRMMVDNKVNCAPRQKAPAVVSESSSRAAHPGRDASSRVDDPDSDHRKTSHGDSPVSKQLPRDGVHLTFFARPSGISLAAADTACLKRQAHFNACSVGGKPITSRHFAPASQLTHQQP